MYNPFKVEVIKFNELLKTLINELTLFVIFEMDDSIFTIVYADSVSSLSKAAKTGDLELIKKLILKGSSPQSPDNRGWTAIHYFVAENQVEALKLILKLKSKNKKHLVNLSTWENVTPLMIALKASKPSFEMVKILLKAGADPTQCTQTRLSPLHLACLKKGNIDLIKLLVQFGANVNVQEDLCLSTPLHLAVSDSHDLEVIKFLMNLSDLNLKNIWDRTAFLEACNSNFFEAVQLFLKKDKNLANFKSSIPPLAYAGLRGNLKMAELLIILGGDANCRCKAMISCKPCDSDLIIFDKESFLPIHSSLSNIEVFKLLLKITDINELLKLETNYYSFSLFVLIYGGEVFFQILSQSDVPNKLKIFDSQVLINFILNYPDMEDIIIEKLPVILKYNFALEPGNIFRTIIFQLPKNKLCRPFKFLHLLAQMGISFGNEFQNKIFVINSLETLMTECKDSESSYPIRSICEILSHSVLTLKQYCRIIIRRQIKASAKCDYLAFKIIEELNLPNFLKKYILFESFN